MAKIKITQKQHDLIIESMVKTKKYSALLTEGNKEVILGAAMIIGTVIGKDMSNFNEVVAKKATSNPKVMAKIKKTFENENDLNELLSNFDNVGMKNADELVRSNADAIVKEYNRIAQSNNMPLLDVDAINNLKGMSSD